MSEVTAVPLRPIPRAGLVMLWLGIAALIVGAIALAWTGTRAQVAMSQPPEMFLAQNAKRSGVVTTPSVVLVNYDGKLANGKTFDASATHGGPATLPVGGLIPGWVEGLQLMNKGSKSRFWIPPSLGYGPQGAGDGVIPPNALLVFDVELLDIAPRPPAGSGISGMDAPPHGGMGQ